jgi:preprotein translocase subunit SecG
MRSLFIGFFSVILVLDCIVLVLLVLVQLPKKEAGAGVAFGGAATDALFGAGSGNVLTRITKWVAGIFFVLSLVLALMGLKPSHKVDTIEGMLGAKAGAQPAAVSHAVSQTPGATNAITAPVKPAAEATTPAVPAVPTAPKPASTNK